jgi:hypothetical protein
MLLLSSDHSVIGFGEVICSEAGQMRPVSDLIFPSSAWSLHAPRREVIEKSEVSAIADR